MAKANAPKGDRRYAANRPPSGQTDDSRKKLIVAVRAACRRLGIDDDTRKAIQAETVGKASMSDMTLPELGRLLDHLNRDWKGPMGHRAHLGKVKALWWSLYWLGAVESGDDKALSAFVERQTGITHLRFLDHRKAPAVIEALKAWLERTGVRWQSAEIIASIAAHSPGYSALHADRHAVLTAITKQLHIAKVFVADDYVGYLHRAMGLTLAHTRWTPTELDAAIRMLGKKHRAALEKSALVKPAR